MRRAIVIGSGPSGATAAQVLTDRDWSVVMLDLGRIAGPDVHARMERARSPSGLGPDDRKVLYDSLLARKIPLKMVWGSAFPYALSSAPQTDTGEEPGIFSSQGFGGFSTVWGAALLRLHRRDYQDWPLTPEALAPHYSAVERILRPSMRKDDLWDAYPFDEEASWTCGQSLQARRILEHLAEHRSALAETGTTFGASRLAIQSGCIGCRLCMYGCPYQAIFSSVSIVEALRERSHFTYRPGVEAIALHDGERSASVTVRNDNGMVQTLTADKVIVAAGPIATPMLILRSNSQLDEIVIKDSQYSLLPLVLCDKILRHDEKMHVLSEIFIETNNADVSDHPLHTQLYMYNDLFLEKIRRPFPAASRPLLSPLTSWASRHLVLAQSYLHSDESGRIALRLKPGDGTPILEGRTALQTRDVVKRLWRHLAKVLRRGRMFALIPMGEISPLGRGYHCGASLPMQRHPSEMAQSDLLGRPFGWRSIHVVDGSVLPTIPSTAPTITIMANAHRIAVELATDPN